MVEPVRLGENQRSLLALLGSTMFLVVGDRRSRSLIAKGYAKAFGSDSDSFVAITPAGLRRLADELEAGRIEQKLPARKEAVANRATPDVGDRG